MEPRRGTGAKRPRVPSGRPRPDRRNQKAVDALFLSPTARLLILLCVSTLEPPECGRMAIISSAWRNPNSSAHPIAHAHDDELTHAECHRFCRLSSGQYSPEIGWELFPRGEHSTNHRCCQAASRGCSVAAPQPATLHPYLRRRTLSGKVLPINHQAGMARKSQTFIDCQHAGIR
jgi:hypothetical protein